MILSLSTDDKGIHIPTYILTHVEGCVHTHFIRPHITGLCVNIYVHMCTYIVITAGFWRLGCRYSCKNRKMSDEVVKPNSCVCVCLSE